MHAPNIQANISVMWTIGQIVAAIEHPLHCIRYVIDRFGLASAMCAGNYRFLNSDVFEQVRRQFVLRTRSSSTHIPAKSGEGAKNAY